jgi:hypothetical protein
MPPEEDEVRLPRLTDEELTILRDWVAGGAPPLPTTPAPPPLAVDSLAAQAKAILHRHCYECHKYDEAKGGIKIMNHRLLVTIRKVVIPGEPEHSELFQLLTTTDKTLRMPPPGEGAPLTPEEIETIRRWIAEGAAPFPKG